MSFASFVGAARDLGGPFQRVWLSVSLAHLWSGGHFFFSTSHQTPLTFSRWAGLGSHRHPIGFSGDTYTEWSSLAFQPSFTAAAGNVLFWWSHDIGGHRSKHDAAAYDPELYLRWIQVG